MYWYSVLKNIHSTKMAQLNVTGIYSFVAKQINDRKSCSLSTLSGNLRGQPSNTEVRRLLQADRHLKPLFNVTHDDYIDIKTPALLCEHHYSKPGCQESDCQKLHICKFYAVGSLTHQGHQQCQFGHDFYSSHNTVILKNLNLPGILPADLQVAYKNCRQVGVTVPDVCTFYNTAGGCTNKKCPFLHICKHYFNMTCKFGKTCKRSHNVFDDQPKAVLDRYNVDINCSPKEVLQNLRDYMNIQGRVKGTSESSTDGEVDDPRPFVPGSSKGRPAATRERARALSGSSNESDEGIAICSYNLNGKCSFGSKCRNLHHSEPYKWQFQQDSTWQNFTDQDNKDLEKCFRDPQNEMGYASVKGRTGGIHFALMSMSLGRETLPVRRLSTLSSVKASPRIASTATTWRWYWKDITDKFVMYGDMGLTETSRISSKEIEERYQEDHNAELDFESGNHKYKLMLSRMEQKNKHYGTVREVRRRPVETTKTAGQASSGQVTKLPLHWTAMAGTETYELVKIPNTGSEYQQVADLFHKTMPDAVITRIKRIQNEELWEKYAWKKGRMLKKHADSVNEMRVFHGTRKDFMAGICEQGFDWRLTGSRVGTLYGKGSYFHRDALYSTNYTDCHRMFVVKVLVGEYTQGRPEMLRPPPIDPADPNKLYDSVVDNPRDPKIHVIFTHEQTYPEYIVNYELK